MTNDPWLLTYTFQWVVLVNLKLFGPCDRLIILLNTSYVIEAQFINSKITLSKGAIMFFLPKGCMTALTIIYPNLFQCPNH